MPTTDSQIVEEALKLMETDCFGKGVSKASWSAVRRKAFLNFNEVPRKLKDRS